MSHMESTEGTDVANTGNGLIATCMVPRLNEMRLDWRAATQNERISSAAASAATSPLLHASKCGQEDSLMLNLQPRVLKPQEQGFHDVKMPICFEEPYHKAPQSNSVAELPIRQEQKSRERTPYEYDNPSPVSKDNMREENQSESARESCLGESSLVLACLGPSI